MPPLYRAKPVPVRGHKVAASGADVTCRSARACLACQSAGGWPAWDPLLAVSLLLPGSIERLRDISNWLSDLQDPREVSVSVSTGHALTPSTSSGHA